jgi:hypothetical protein
LKKHSKMCLTSGVVVAMLIVDGGGFVEGFLDPE